MRDLKAHGGSLFESVRSLIFLGCFLAFAVSDAFISFLGLPRTDAKNIVTRMVKEGFVKAIDVSVPSHKRINYEVQKTEAARKKIKAYFDLDLMKYEAYR